MTAWSAPATTPAPIPGSGKAFDCFGGAVYSLQFDSATGVEGIDALDPKTDLPAGIDSKRVVDLPAGAKADGLAITDGGGIAYAVQQDASGVTVPLYVYDAKHSAWSTTQATAVAGAKFVAGAYDPRNHVYYYASYDLLATKPTATIFGYDVEDNAAIPGPVATVTLPLAAPKDSNGDIDSAVAAKVDGDMAFDRAGNLYLAESLGKSTAVTTVAGPLPVKDDAKRLAASHSHTYLDKDGYVYGGIAFNNRGRLYLEGSNSNGTALRDLEPNTGKAAHLHSRKIVDGDATGVDLAACSLNPTLSVTYRADKAGKNYSDTEIAVSGTKYSVHADTAAPSGETKYSCTDAAHAGRPIASGSGSSFKLTFPAPLHDETGPQVTCTFTTAVQASNATSSKSSALAKNTKPDSSTSHNSTKTSLNSGTGPSSPALHDAANTIPNPSSDSSTGNSGNSTITSLNGGTAPTQTGKQPSTLSNSPNGAKDAAGKPASTGVASGSLLEIAGLLLLIGALGCVAGRRRPAVVTASSDDR